MTRKLVDVAHDIIVTIEDCQTLNGIDVKPISEGDDELVTLAQRSVGRTTAEDIVDPRTRELILPAGEMIDEVIAQRIEDAGLDQLRLRSALTCEATRGICAKCYGRNLATSKPVELGAPVGIIAAQSIGEPGTQLTMRTFHIGGTASTVSTQNSFTSKNSGTVKMKVFVSLRLQRVLLS